MHRHALSMLLVVVGLSGGIAESALGQVESECQLREGIGCCGEGGRRHVAGVVHDREALERVHRAGLQGTCTLVIVKFTGAVNQ